MPSIVAWWRVPMAGPVSYVTHHAGAEDVPAVGVPRVPRGMYRERGSMTVELVVLVPVLILFMLFAVAFGRVERARQEVIAAARAGAEAASVMPSAGQAQVAAADAAVPSVFNQQFTCQPLNVQTDTSGFRPGGVVTVHVSCTVHLSDLLIPGFPGSGNIDESRSAPIDPYRVVQDG